MSTDYSVKALWPWLHERRCVETTSKFRIEPHEGLVLREQSLYNMHSVYTCVLQLDLNDKHLWQGYISTANLNMLYNSSVIVSILTLFTLSPNLSISLSFSPALRPLTHSIEKCELTGSFPWQPLQSKPSQCLSRSVEQTRNEYRRSPPLQAERQIWTLRQRQEKVRWGDEVRPWKKI